MQTQRGKALLFVLLADLVITVMPLELMVSVMPGGNDTTMGIPRMTPEFKEMAKKLMLKCSKMGYQPPAIPELAHDSSAEEEGMMPRNPFSLFPSLLSSLPPPPPPPPLLTSSRLARLSNSSVDGPDMEADWNVTEQLLNVTTLPEMIDIMKNSTDQPRCFLQTFISPVAWSAIMQNGLWVQPEDLSKLLWAAKPYLENMPSQYIDLPPRPDRPRLAEMMKMFSEVFSSLSEEQRDQIREWVKASVLENEFNCVPNNPAQRPKPPLAWIMGAKPKPGRPGALGPVWHDPKSLLDSEGRKRVRCPPRQPWLNITVLRIMGRFLSRLSPQEVRAIPSEALCQFFQSQDFPPSFQRVGAIKASLGRTIMSRLRTCSSSSQEFLQHTASLGSLACFYDGRVASLNATISKRLLSQLEECQNSASKKLKKQLVRKLFSSADAVPGPELLESLGSAVSALPPSRLIRFSAKALANTLPSLSRATWSAAQAKTLAKALLKTQNISSSDLLSLGTVVRGVASSVLQSVRGEELLRGEERERLEGVSQKMSSLQRKALLKGMRSSVNVSALVLNVPAPLLSSLSLSTLGRARLTSMEQLEGRKWTRAQSAFLLKKILGRKLKRQHLRRLGQAIQGVTCEMIDSLIQNETMESMEALSQSFGWLDKTQISCAARKLFDTLEQNRTDYFSNVTEDELQSIPAMMIIHLPARRIRGLPVSVCGVFLEKMAAVNLSCLPHSSPSRSALTQRALDCLGKNMSDVSTEEVLSLGPLLCELAPRQLRSLAPEVLNSTLLELASCPYIRRSYRAPLFRMVTDMFGQPSDWSEEDMMSLRPFLLLDNSTLRTLPNRPWLRSSLSDLMDSLPAQTSAMVPEEFRPSPDLSTLRWKLFVLTTREDSQTSAPAQRRRRREAMAADGPTSDLMEELGEDNVFWSPAQLANMSSETFTESASQLGEIRDFTDEQLASLRQKAIESLGPVEQLNESQVVELGCVSQGFSAEELRQLNISTLDTLELLSTCKWTQAQRRAVWQGFTERTGVSAAGLAELDVVGLGQFICGLQPDEAQQLANDSFREAAEAIGCTPCEMPQLESFKRKAVAVFGEPQSWSEGQVMSLGNIMAGLEAAELQSLNSSVLSFIMSSAIPLIPPMHLAALSVSQLQALGPDNAAMVTEAQQAELGEEQRKGLADALGVAYTRTEEPSSGGSQSGASGQENSPVPQTGGSTSLTMGGIVVFLKPLLFLLLGFMLD
ncbi:otoancorin [Sardina pilchardus]|uniref:otoancorin n=1 Tax=Sardina pilchardus TaxID=27697 RepID=UPI002E13CCB8